MGPVHSPRVPVCLLSRTSTLEERKLDLPAQRGLRDPRVTCWFYMIAQGDRLSKGNGTIRSRTLLWSHRRQGFLEELLMDVIGGIGPHELPRLAGRKWHLPPEPDDGVPDIGEGEEGGPLALDAP